jgi:hypothetical protein
VKPGIVQIGSRRDWKDREADVRRRYGAAKGMTGFCKNLRINR